MFLAPPFFEFYMRTNLADEAVLPLGWAEAEVGETNICVEIGQERMPDKILPQVAFFTLDALDGLGGDGDDDDGDGLSNAEERTLGTNPRRADTDGDGYDDGQEVSVVRYGTSFPVFDLSNVSNIFAGTQSYAIYPAYTVVNLPFSVELAGHFSTNVVVYFAGIAEFLPLGMDMPSDHVSPYSPSLIYSTSNAVFSAYGYMFMFMGYSGSQLRAGVVTDAQGRWFVAEWRDMLDPVGWSNLTVDQASFQLAVSEAEPDTVHVRYTNLDNAFDGTSAIIGAHGFDGIPDLLVANDVSGSVTNGMTITYRFGSGTNALCADTDGDGLPDGWEAAYGMDPLSANTGDPRTDASADPDLDGLTNMQEAALRTNPFQPDTDGDGMDDGWETRYGFDPVTHNDNTARADDDADADPDGDGLTNSNECAWGTNPSGTDVNGDGRPDGLDTDNDGVSDDIEIAQNSDPADAADEGRPNSRVAVSFYFGDHSTSHSEKYQLTVTPVVNHNTNLPRMFSWVNANYGACETRTAMLMPGYSYEVRLAHASTNRPQGPDYDYTLNVIDVPQPVIVSDPDCLLGVHLSNSTFAGDGLVATIHVLAPPQITAPKAIGVNNDDDNGNGTSDDDDEGELVGDDDIVEVTVSATCPAGVSGTVTVSQFLVPIIAKLWKDVGRTQEMGASETFSVTSGDTVTRTYYLEGLGTSSLYLDSRIRASLVCGVATSTNEHRFTVVERIAEPITTERVNGQIANPCCSIIGEAVPMKVSVLPADFPDSEIKWRVVSGSGTFADGGTGRNVSFTATGFENSETKLQVDVGDCPGRAPQFTLRETTMHEVKIYPCAISDGTNPSPITDVHLESLIAGVNTIFRQVGLHFTLGAGVTNIIDAGWATNGLSSTSVANQIRNVMNGTDGLELYFVPGSNNVEPVGVHNSFGIIVKNSADAIVLAHEFGHACGLYDIYCSRLSITPPDFESNLRNEWMPDDWNNGTGARFYDALLTHGDAVRRLLMHGQRTTSQSDIPSGCVWGLDADGMMGFMSVGWAGIMTTSPRSL